MGLAVLTLVTCMFTSAAPSAGKATATVPVVTPPEVVTGPTTCPEPENETVPLPV